MKQKAPDKIFIGIKTDGVFSTYTTVCKDYPGAVVYISKEALIKWAENWSKYKLRTDDGFLYAMETLVQHLESM